MDYLVGAVIFASGILSTAVYRRMLKLSWIGRIRNHRNHCSEQHHASENGKNLEVLRTIKKRKLEFFENVMRNTQSMSFFN